MSFYLVFLPAWDLDSVPVSRWILLPCEQKPQVKAGGTGSDRKPGPWVFSLSGCLGPSLYTQAPGCIRKLHITNTFYLVYLHPWWCYNECFPKHRAFLALFLQVSSYSYQKLCQSCLIACFIITFYLFSSVFDHFLIFYIFGALASGALLTRERLSLVSS